MTAKTTVAVAWRAARDGEAHAIRARATRTLCGQRPTPEQLAWPTLTRCSACVDELERLEASMPQR